jgi:exosortase/archaeosortase family protein
VARGRRDLRLGRARRRPELQAVALVPALLGAANLLGGLAALRVVAVPPRAPVRGADPRAAAQRDPLAPADLDRRLHGAAAADAHGAGARLGRPLILDRGLFAIIETCSGLRSIETLALLAILMIDLFGRRGRHAACCCSRSPFVAFLINGLRCLGLIFNPHADIASIHNLQGIAMLLGGVLLLYFLDGRSRGCSPHPADLRPWNAMRAHRDRATRLEPRIAVLVGFSAAARGDLVRAAVRQADVRRERARCTSSSARRRLAERPISTPTGCSSGRRVRQIVHRRYCRRPSRRPVRRPGRPGRARRAATSRRRRATRAADGRRAREHGAVAGATSLLRVLRKGAYALLAASWYEASPGLAAETTRALVALDATRSRPARDSAGGAPLYAAARRPAARVERRRQRLERFARALSAVSLQRFRPHGNPASVEETLFPIERKRNAASVGRPRARINQPSMNRMVRCPFGGMSIAHRRCNKARVGTTYPCVVRVREVWTAFRLDAEASPGGSGAGCKTTEPHGSAGHNQRFWPNAEYAKHRGVTE